MKLCNSSVIMRISRVVLNSTTAIISATSPSGWETKAVSLMITRMLKISASTPGTSNSLVSSNSKKEYGASLTEVRYQSLLNSAYAFSLACLV